MVRSPFAKILVMYFMTGVMMVGGGAMKLTDRNPVTLLFSVTNGQVATDTAMVNHQFGIVGSMLGPFISAGMAVLLALFEVFQAALQFLNWPIIALSQGNAPPVVVLVLGGPLTLLFYLSLFGTLRRAT